MKKFVLSFLICAAVAQTASAQKLYSSPCGTFTPREGNVAVQKIDTTPGRAVANQYLVWDADEPITVKFMGTASTALRNSVMGYAKEWEQIGRIKFQFVPDNTPSTNIRIMLGEGLGHNSYVGTNCNDIAQNQQTMNLDTVAFLDYKHYIADMKRRGVAVSMDELRRMLRQGVPVWDHREMRKTTLHEFGHALGLLHEQSFPGAIKWNKDTVYKYYAKTQGWDKEKTASQVFTISQQFFTNGTQYDSKSIMHYPVESWQTTNGFSLPANFDLSMGDKAIVSALYPSNPGADTVVPRITVKDLSLLDVVNDSVKGGISIYPSFDMRTNAKLGTVYVVAMLVDENGYYIKDNNDFYNWGGYVAVYPRLTTLPNSRTAYNKSKRNLELFLPYSEIPVVPGQKVRFRLSVVLQDAVNNQFVYVTNRFPDRSFSVAKR